MSKYLDDLSSWTAGIQLCDVPDHVLENARLVLADTIAVIVGGSAGPEMQSLSRKMARGGMAPVIGTDRRASGETAAFLNGTAGTFLEMDEGNQFARGHPAIHVIPALLSEAATANSTPDAETFMRALILGYEIGSRIGIACKIRPSMHPHGTWGTVGAAVGVASLRRAGASDIREVINISSTLALATSRPTMLQGATVRNTYSGFSNRMGIFAMDLFAAGFTGENDGLSTVFGRVVSDEFVSEAMTEELGKRWEIGRNYFKLHACCRYNHGALDALMKLLEQYPGAINGETIAKIVVNTYSLAAELSDQEPRNVLAGKFSLPFAIATTIHNGDTGVESFTGDKVLTGDIRDLAKMVTVTEDSKMTALMPEKRPARVVITLNDGKILSSETETNRGDSEDPYSESEIRTKFNSLAKRVWSETKIDTAWDAARSYGNGAETEDLLAAVEVMPSALSGMED